MAQAEKSDRDKIVDMLTGCWRTRVIYDAVRLGIADELSAGAQGSAELAKACGTDSDATRRLLRALSVLGLCRQIGADRFELTKAGQCLRSDAPDSIQGVAKHWGGRLWESFGRLGETLETGEPTMATAPEDFVKFQADPEEAEIFNRAMAEQSFKVGEAMARAYDFSRFDTLLDVGGGYGAVLAALLKAYPQARGAVVEIASVEAGARTYLAEAGVGDRAEFLAADFFKSVPPGDCMILKFIIHDWNDENSRTILKNCRGALAPGGVVLLIERIVPDIVSATAADEGIICGDLIMMTVGGKERTEGEYRALLAEAGLTLTQIVPTGTAFSIIEAKAA